MPVQIFRNVKFSNTHENLIFDELILKLEEQWKDSKELIILIGNFSLKGSQVDALVVKNDSITIIDFKNYGGKIIFSENGNWKADGVDFKIVSSINPYLQIYRYKSDLEIHLRTNKILNENSNIKFGHITGLALFHQKIEFDNRQIPPKIASWFHATDIYNAANLIYNITSTVLNLNDEELLKFPLSFGVEQYEFQRPKITEKQEDFANRKGLNDAFNKLEDIHKSIVVAKSGSRKLVQRHKEFIDYFYADRTRPEEELGYNLRSSYKKYEERQQVFISEQTDKLNLQIQVIYNLNSNNGFILNEFAGNKLLKDCLSSSYESSKIFLELQQRFNIDNSYSNLGISTLSAYKDIFFIRGIYDEQPFRYIRKEINKKEGLVNYLNALYSVLSTWFSDDMLLQHDYPRTMSNIKEYIFVRGISEKWYSHMMTSFGEEPVIEYFDEFNITKSDIDFETELPISTIINKYIAIVKIPSGISSLLSELRSELSKILNSEELNGFLDLLGLHWIGSEYFDIRELYILNLKTHLVFSNLHDNSYLQTVGYANKFLYEPFYLTCLEQIGQWGFYKKHSDSELFEKTYECLPKDIVSRINHVISKWSPYKPKYQKNTYAVANYKSLGEVSEECRTSLESLIKFLDSIGRNYKAKLVYVTSPEDIHANYDYKILLKRFKALSSDGIVLPKKLSDSIEQVIIGYDDIKQYIVERLDAYKNPEESRRFGISSTAGIILYGPPGCGKTHWANWISKYLDLKIVEIPRSLIGSSFSDGAMNRLTDKLDEVEEISPAAIFFDEFDSIGKAREKSIGSNDEGSKIVTTLLTRIPKLIEKGLIVIAATNFINDIDAALIRPGRFDLHIPIFPPLPLERAEIISHYLGSKSADAIIDTLANNSADEKEFWIKYTESMFLFSISHVLDFCDELKNYIYNLSKTTEIDDIALKGDAIIGLINTTKSKIRKMDIQSYTRFYNESQNLMGTFKNRMETLKFEIDNFNNEDFNNEYRPVGFKF